MPLVTRRFALPGNHPAVASLLLVFALWGGLASAQVGSNPGGSRPTAALSAEVAVAADSNHNGRMDLHVTDSRQGFTNQLYRNNGDGLRADDLNCLLSDLEAKLRGSLDSFNLASTYRARCADHDQHDRAIKFFSELVATQTNKLRAQIELGCAYVDKIPTCGGVAAVVSKGNLARKALDQMDAVIKQQPDLWVARYTRGLNHLYWPRALRHSDDAVADLTRCVELQEHASAGNPKSYYLRSYLALGDACTKNGKADQARLAWRQGLKLFPNAAELKTRLALENDDALLKFVENQRTLDQPIDTDLTFLDRAP